VCAPTPKSPRYHAGLWPRFGVLAGATHTFDWPPKRLPARVLVMWGSSTSVVIAPARDTTVGRGPWEDAPFLLPLFTHPFANGLQRGKPYYTLETYLSASQRFDKPPRRDAWKSNDCQELSLHVLPFRRRSKPRTSKSPANQKAGIHPYYKSHALGGRSPVPGFIRRVSRTQI